MIDLGVQLGFVEKSGAGTPIWQTRSVRARPTRPSSWQDNPEVAATLEKQIRESCCASVADVQGFAVKSPMTTWLTLIV